MAEDRTPTNQDDPDAAPEDDRDDFVDDEMPSGPERPEGGSGMEPATRGGDDELGSGPISPPGGPG